MACVLVAEDDPEMRRLVVDALVKDGHTVLSAEDGGGMVMLIAQIFHADHSLDRIDVIVSDMRMPVSNGLEQLERIAEAGWNIPSILMTAFGDDDTRRRAAHIGATLLEKPLALADLRLAVRSLTARP